MKKKLRFKKLIAMLLIFYTGYIFVDQQITINKINRDISTQKKELLKAKEKNERLQDEVKMSKTEIYIERLGRERLGLIKEGETPVISANSSVK